MVLKSRVSALDEVFPVLIRAEGIILLVLEVILLFVHLVLWRGFCWTCDLWIKKQNADPFRAARVQMSMCNFMLAARLSLSQRMHSLQKLRSLKLPVSQLKHVNLFTLYLFCRRSKNILINCKHFTISSTVSYLSFGLPRATALDPTLCWYRQHNQVQASLLSLPHLLCLHSLGSIGCKEEKAGKRQKGRNFWSHQPSLCVFTEDRALLGE